MLEKDFHVEEQGEPGDMERLLWREEQEEQEQQAQEAPEEQKTRSLTVKDLPMIVVPPDRE
jgi:hypothetical protein